MDQSTTALNHLAIILDGNRRWAEAHGITEAAVYERAGKNIADVLEAAYDRGIRCVSIWIGSYSNLTNRSKVLVNALDRLYEKKLNELAAHKTVKERGIKIEVIGEWHDLLSQKTIAAAENAIASTAKNTGARLVILIGYDGVRERGEAIKATLSDRPAVPGNPLDAEKLLRDHAWTGHLPDVDLIIRTGAWDDPHSSASFLSFLAADSQFAFPKVLWPDFTAQMLNQVCDDFDTRERRHGK